MTGWWSAMTEKLMGYVISEDEPLLAALKKIDANRQGFLVVADGRDVVLGVLTDGDIRRAFIRGWAASDSLKGVYTRKPRMARAREGFTQVAELFKDQKVKFLPIVDGQGRLVNIITKGQLHALLLRDIHADLSYDFLSLDTGVLDHEVFQRPWGFYKTTVLNDYYQAKVISIRPGGQLSLQSHRFREEHWIVVHGNGTVQVDGSLLEVRCGSSLFIPRGAKHRVTNTDQGESLIITEVQIGDYLGEDDIVRYEDKYGRA